MDTNQELLETGQKSSLGVLRHLLVPGILVAGAAGVLMMLPSTMGGIEAAAPGAATEGPTALAVSPESTQSPALDVEDSTELARQSKSIDFGNDWVLSAASAGAGPSAIGVRSAMYSDGGGAFASVTTTGGEFGFDDLPQIKIGPLNGWVVEDPTAPVFYISVSEDGSTTHLRVVGLDRDQAVAAAGDLFSAGSAGFLDKPADGDVSFTDHLPQGFESFAMVGSSQPGEEPLVPSEAWVAKRGDSATATIKIYEGDTAISVARAELMLNGATGEATGRLVVDSSDYKAASVGWDLDDGRFAVVYSPDLTLAELLPLTEL